MRPAPSLVSAVPVSYGAGGDRPAKLPAHTVPRRHFDELLRLAFPGCRSRAEMAKLAARALDRSPRTVTNWLDGSNEPKASDYLKLLAIAGFEIVLRARP